MCTTALNLMSFNAASAACAAMCTGKTRERRAAFSIIPSVSFSKKRFKVHVSTRKLSVYASRSITTKPTHSQLDKLHEGACYDCQTEGVYTIAKFVADSLRPRNKKISHTEIWQATQTRLQRHATACDARGAFLNALCNAKLYFI